MQDLNDKVNNGGATAAGQLDADEWNQVPTEIQNVIEGLGITLSGGDLNQLGKAIAGYAANGAFYTDGGAADAYVLSAIGSKQVPTAYTDGMAVEFIAGNTSTGASTVNVAGLGVKNIVDTGTAGRIISGKRYQLRYRSGSGDFEIIPILRSQSAPAKAWVNFNGAGVVAVRDSFNVSSITDNGLGDYTVNFTSNMPNANYVAVISSATTAVSGGGANIDSSASYNYLVSSFDVDTWGDSTTHVDAELIVTAVFAN